MNILTKEELEELMHRYYAGEKNSALIKEFCLDVPLNEIHKLFPLIDRHDLSCPYCKTNLKQKPLSKSAQKYGRSNNKAFCDQCGHKNIDSCQCSACSNIRARQAEEKNDLKRDFLRSTRRPQPASAIDPSELSLRDVLSLVSLTRVAGDETSSLIHPLASHSLSFCVRQPTTLEIIEKLYCSELLEISMESDLRAIELSNESKPAINLELLSWELRLGKNSNDHLNAIDALEDLFRNKEEWPPTWKNELVDIWKELALEEILAYLELKLIEHQFTPRIGDKTKKTFMSLLQDFPVSKIYNFIWGSVTNAAAYQVRSGVSKQQAANTVIGNCQKRAERSVTENWTTKDYQKNYQTPDSMRVSVFSNVITTLGNRFFTTPPKIEEIYLSWLSRL